MKYAGVENVAILDGGFNKWVQEKRAVSRTVTKAKERLYSGVIRKDMFVDKDYLLKNFDRLILLDVREPDYFAGKRKLDCIDRAGRLPGAINLPTSWIFTPERTFKSKEQFTTMAEAAVGTDRSKQQMDRPGFQVIHPVVRGNRGQRGDHVLPAPDDRPGAQGVRRREMSLGRASLLNAGTL